MSDMIMEAKSLCKRFRSADRSWLTAVDHVSLSLRDGQTLGLLGQSGSGKSTLGQMLVGLIKPDSGEVFYRGAQLHYPIRGEARRKIQILFQHPEVAFNPQLTLRQSLREPFRLIGKSGTDREILDVISAFGLYEEHLSRRPGSLSGGELQRAALARITVLQPEMILLDEPTSMLDVITQAQMIDFLRQYQAAHHTAYLFITHSTALARQFCDEIIKIDGGRLV